MSDRRTAATRGQLLEEAEHLRRSLDDLAAERDAGDLSAGDYELLRDKYLSRGEEVEAALADLAELPGPPATPMAPRTARQRRRTILLWTAAGCFVAAATLLGLAWGGVPPFARSGPATLTVAARIRTELGEAGVLADNKEIAQAIGVYDEVLQLDPEQPQALANAGWLIRLAGIAVGDKTTVEGADSELARAVSVAPSYALARAYYGVALYEDEHRPRASVSQFRALLADKPSTTLLGSVEPVAEKAYAAARAAFPSGWPQTVPSST